MGSKLLSISRIQLRGSDSLNIGLQALYTFLNGVVILTIFITAIGPAIEMKFPDTDFTNFKDVVVIIAMTSYAINIIASVTLSVLDQKKAEAKAETDRKALEAELIEYRPSKTGDPTDRKDTDEASIQSHVRHMRFCPITL